MYRSILIIALVTTVSMAQQPSPPSPKPLSIEEMLKLHEMWHNKWCPILAAARQNHLGNATYEKLRTQQQAEYEAIWNRPTAGRATFMKMIPDPQDNTKQLVSISTRMLTVSCHLKDDQQLPTLKPGQTIYYRGMSSTPGVDITEAEVSDKPFPRKENP